MSSNRRFWYTFLGCSAISVVYLILGWFHWRLVLVPAKPDEVAHLEYIVDILDGRFWPVMKKGEILPCLDERHQPPLYYWVSASSDAIHTGAQSGESGTPPIHFFGRGTARQWSRLPALSSGKLSFDGGSDLIVAHGDFVHLGDLSGDASLAWPLFQHADYSSRRACSFYNFCPDRDQQHGSIYPD